jgi:DNA-binding Lrp family transcriptional regulator
MSCVVMPSTLPRRRQGVQQYDETLCNLSNQGAGMDDLDVRLIELFAHDPRIGVLEASRRLAVARGTAQARLDRLVRDGVITGWGPELSPDALGFPVTAFLTLEIRQGVGHDAVATHLSSIPEVLEAFTITGAGDMWCRVVARSNADLQRVIDQVLGNSAIERSTTVIALAEQIPRRMLPLARAAISPATELRNRPSTELRNR